MSRKTFDPDEEQPPLPPHGVPSSVADRLPCMRCGTATERKTLSECGARCWSCYQAYKREPQPRQYCTQVGQQPNAREVVQRLLDRKAAGEAMSKAQLDFIATASRKTHPELHHGDQP
jgi:hypothetical protein